MPEKTLIDTLVIPAEAGISPGLSRIPASAGMTDECAVIDQHFIDAPPDQRNLDAELR